jgi:hypothetical protein
LALEAALGASAAGGLIYILAKTPTGKTVEIPVKLYDALVAGLQPVDNPGDTPTTPRILPMHISDGDISLTGTWTKINSSVIGGSPVWHGYDLKSAVVGDRVDLSYEGCDVWIRFRLGVGMGKADIYIDNMSTPIVTLDLSSTMDQYQLIPFGMDLKRAHHNLRIKVNVAPVELNGIVIKYFRGSHQIFAYPESTLGTSSSFGSIGNILEQDSYGGAGGPTSSAFGSAAVANTNFVTASIVLAAAQMTLVVCQICSNTTAIYNVLRDGVVIGTGTAGAQGYTLVKINDSGAAGGTRLYALQFTTAVVSVAATINVISASGDEAHGSTSGGVADLLQNGINRYESVTMTLRNAATVFIHCYIFNNSGGGSITAVLKRDTTQLDSRVIGNLGAQFYTITDSNVPAGTYVYQLDSGTVQACGNGLVAMSAGG